jgi:hypothetical protein
MTILGYFTGFQLQGAEYTFGFAYVLDGVT